MTSSDSQAMGGVGEVMIRTWQTAHKWPAAGPPPSAYSDKIISAQSATSPSTD